KMEHVALVRQRSRHEGVIARRTRPGSDGLQVLFVYAEDHVGRPRQALADPGVPPAELEIGAGGPFARQERVANAVGHVEQPNARILKKDSVMRQIILARYAEITGERHEKLGARR